MSFPELSRARFVAGVTGFVCSAIFLVVLFFAGNIAAHLSAGMHALTGGKPLPPLTEFLVNVDERLTDNGLLFLLVLLGAFCLAYLPLLLALRRAGSVAYLGVCFSAWLGLLLSAELLLGVIVTLALVLPVILVTATMRS